jgi:hypothetical protein
VRVERSRKSFAFTRAVAGVSSLSRALLYLTVEKKIIRMLAQQRLQRLDSGVASLRGRHSLELLGCEGKDGSTDLRRRLAGRLRGGGP